MPKAVLLIEDNPGDVSLISEALTRTSPEVSLTAVGTIGEAVAALAEVVFDCVLLDLGLPDAYGLDGLESLLTGSPPPIVVLTGRGEDSLALAAISRGADDYLGKTGLTPEILGKAIRYAVERRSVANLLRKQQEQYRWIVESLAEGVVVYGSAGEVLSFNGAAQNIIGEREWLSCFAAANDGGSLLLPDGQALEASEYPVEVALRSGKPVIGFTVGVARPNGAVRWLSVNSIPVFERGEPGEISVVTSFQDITPTRDAERRVQLGFEQAAMGIAIADDDGRFTEVNPSLCSMLGRAKEELLGTTLADYAKGATYADYASQLTSSARDNHAAELQFVRADGTELWFWVTTTLVRDVGVDQYWIEQVQDITDRKLTEAALEELALSDALTTLPNRNLLMDRINRSLAQADQNGSRVTVFLVGIDRFKGVNDSLGHSAGDELLIQLAERLQLAAPNNTVARFGGDVFAAVLEGAIEVADAMQWSAQHLSGAINGQFELNGSNLYITSSTGIALSTPGMTAGELVRNADLAMNRAKAAGGAHVVTFADHDLDEVRERLELENDLRIAITEQQIHVWYQPVVRTLDHYVLAAEALVRWEHPRRGTLLPDLFIPVISRLGLMRELTSYVLVTACAQLVRWKSQGRVNHDLRVAVNLSADDVVDTGLVDMVRHALDCAGLDPGDLVLEVTETGLIRDTAIALSHLRELRRLGVRIAVDDFGTGYSSLSYLKLFPVDAVKIDKSFVLGLGRDAEATALVRGILSLTRSLGLAAVAEGIENDVQLEALRQLGCPLAQGFYFCRPVPAEEFPKGANDVPAPNEKELLAHASPELQLPEQVSDQDHHLGLAVLDALPTAVAVLGTGGVITATNLAWKRFTLENGGNASTGGVGANYLEVCEKARGPGADDASLAARGLRAVLAGERDAFSLEYDCSDKTALRRFLMLVSPVVTGSGAVVVAHLDLTDRRLAEEALAESEERFRSIFDQAPLGIFRLDTNGRIVDANRALCALVGKPAKQLYGSSRDALFDDCVEEAPMSAAWPNVRAEHPDNFRHSSKRRVRRPDGSVRVVQVNDVVVHDKDGTSRALVATVEDVTDGLQLAEELQRAQEMEALGRLAGGIAHEINTPTQFISDNLAFLTQIWEPVAKLLRAALDAADCLLGGGSPADVAISLRQRCEAADLDFVQTEVPAALAQSQEGVDRVASIVRAMKAFGHPDSSDPEPTDLNQLANNTITVARTEIRYVADVATDFGTLPNVPAYQGTLGQVILNLLVNAAHAVGESGEATGKRGLITVKTWVDGTQVCLSVSDTGPGIPPDVLPHIFTPFFTTKSLGRGTGQGLALAWAAIVERHRGQIDVATSSTGTTFTIKLPIGTGVTAKKLS